MITVGIITAGIVILILGVVLIVAKVTLKERVLDQIKRITEANMDEATQIGVIKFLLEDQDSPKRERLVPQFFDEPLRPEQVAREDPCKAEKLIIGEDARLSMSKPASKENK